MLHAWGGDGRQHPLAADTTECVRAPGGGVWIDAESPTEPEVATVARLTGFDLPDLDQLSEVEVSSRLRRVDETLYLSLPLVFRDEQRRPRIAPVGFVLSADWLVTVRFEELKAFAHCKARIEESDIHGDTSIALFIALLESIVDRLADVLEESGNRLDEMSDRMFGAPGDPVLVAGRPKMQDALLRGMLRKVAHERQLVSKVRATLLGLGRTIPYVQGEGSDWVPAEDVRRLDTVLKDVTSLDEYETHLADKVQFLLDADLGMIQVEQNDRFRVLTVVSVVGIPPTFFASMWGMNFKHMPELDWLLGYPMALAVIVGSALVPLGYFRLRGWI